MLHAPPEFVDPNQMMRELLASVRDTNRRLEEIRIMVQSDAIKKVRKPAVISRYERLTETRFCLIYSIYDMRQKFIKQVSDEHRKDEIEKSFALDKLFKDLATI